VNLLNSIIPPKPQKPPSLLLQHSSVSLLNSINPPKTSKTNITATASQFSIHTGLYKNPKTSKTSITAIAGQFSELYIEPKKPLNEPVSLLFFCETTELPQNPKNHAASLLLQHSHL